MCTLGAKPSIDTQANRAMSNVRHHTAAAASVAVSEHQPGTGNSFGFLALEVLNHARGG